MTSSTTTTTTTQPPPQNHHYTPLPPQPNPPPRQLLHSLFNWHILCTVTLLLLAALAYIFWPSDPHVKIHKLHLKHIQVHTKPVICIDITLNVTLKVHNVNVFSMDYKSLDVAVKYRERKLGHVKSGKGRVRALGSSFIIAFMEMECVKVFSEFVLFLEDLARGKVPFHTVTDLEGRLGLFLFRFPFQAKIACEVLLNTNDQTIERQYCRPK